MFFKKKNFNGPTGPLTYPSGTCIKTPSGYWYILGGKRYRIITERILRSWSFPRIAQGYETNIGRYKPAGKLGFRNNSLLYNLSNGKIYLVVDNKLRHVTNPDRLSEIGASFDEAIIVSTAELKLHQEGESLD